MNLSIIVVLYNALPKAYVFDVKQCNVIIVDNTPYRDLMIEGDNITYIPLMDNFGIAKALNKGFMIAESQGAEWVLTMDQDSDLPSNMIEAYLSFIRETNGKIGLLAPLINMYAGENKKVSNGYMKIDEAITSGSLINCKAFNDVGGFKDELFIDGVDFEFCWNLRRHGYSIYQLNNVLMQHQLGDSKEYSLFGKHLFYVTNHNYIRRYYMTRNFLYVRKLYGDIMPKSTIPYLSSLISLFKIILFEKDVLRKLRARRLGIKDFKRNKLGKFDYDL